MNWTREQIIVAFRVYCKIPFKSSLQHPEIIKYAKLIGRSPSALIMKIRNIVRLDPQLKKRGITGLSHGSKLEKEIWDEFHGNWEKLIYESELLIAQFQNKNIEDIVDIVDIDLSSFPQGEERERVLRTRVNQNFFRSTILSSYNQKCCITGLPLLELLVASHIVPWSKNKEERLNPRNGLCLNALHDKAFDKGLITVSTDYKIIVSSNIMDSRDVIIKKYFAGFHNKKIFTPDKFHPKREFLEYHNNNIFQDS